MIWLYGAGILTLAITLNHQLTAAIPTNYHTLPPTMPILPSITTAYDEITFYIHILITAIVLILTALGAWYITHTTRQHLI